MKRPLFPGNEDSNYDAMNRHYIAPKKYRLESEPSIYPAVQSGVQFGSPVLPPLRSLNVQPPPALPTKHNLSRLPPQPQGYSNHAGERLRQLREKYSCDVSLVYQECLRASLFISNLDDVLDSREKKKLEHGMSTLKMLVRLLQRDPKQLSVRHVPYLTFIEAQIKRKVLPMVVLIRTIPSRDGISVLKAGSAPTSSSSSLPLCLKLLLI